MRCATPQPRRSPARPLLAAVALCVLGGCTTYRAAPLPDAADVRANAADLKTDMAQLRLAPLKAVTLDPRRGFTPVDTAALAALNNPDLRAKRAAMGVSAAQVFAAGLLPDPQITTGLDQPIAGPDTHTAFSVSPGLDIAGLLARISNEHAARDTARAADLNLLWAEWTTAQQARQLAETALTNEAREGFLRDLLVAVADRADRSQAAMRRGDVTAQTAAADLAAKLDMESLLASAGQAARKARGDLNALLGLDAGVRVPLIEDAGPDGYGPAEVRARLAGLPNRRPDLLALQAGYAAQDANLRKAILAQFPLAQIAFAYARDPTPTTTVGLQAVLALPIFNGGRGEVRVQSATRDQLRAEYQARLDQTDNDVKAAAAERDAALTQAQALRADLPRLEQMLAPAPAAFARGDMDSQTYLALLQAVVGKRAELEDRELAARMAEIQLETALFVPPAGLEAAP
jgi:multidrug efflux system outer membrane protein